jgi:hypothetical protein
MYIDKKVVRRLIENVQNMQKKKKKKKKEKESISHNFYELKFQ